MPYRDKLSEQEIQALVAKGYAREDLEGREFDFNDKTPDTQVESIRPSVMSQGQAIKSTLKANAGSLIGSGLGAGAGMALTAGTGGLAAFTVPLLAGFGGSLLGGKAQELALPEEYNRELQEAAAQAYEEHPVTSTLANVIPGALLGGAKPSLSNMRLALTGTAGKRVAATIADKAEKEVALRAATAGLAGGEGTIPAATRFLANGISETAPTVEQIVARETANAVKIARGNVILGNAIGVGGNAGLEASHQLYETGEIDLSELGKSALIGTAQGLVFTNPNFLGRKFNKHWKTPEEMARVHSEEVGKLAELHDDLYADAVSEYDAQVQHTAQQNAAAAIFASNQTATQEAIAFRAKGLETANAWYELNPTNFKKQFKKFYQKESGDAGDVRNAQQHNAMLDAMPTAERRLYAYEQALRSADVEAADRVKAQREASKPSFDQIRNQRAMFANEAEQQLAEQHANEKKSQAFEEVRQMQADVDAQNKAADEKTWQARIDKQIDDANKRRQAQMDATFSLEENKRAAEQAKIDADHEKWMAATEIANQGHKTEQARLKIEAERAKAEAARLSNPSMSNVQPAKTKPVPATPDRIAKTNIRAEDLTNIDRPVQAPDGDNPNRGTVVEPLNKYEEMAEWFEGKKFKAKGLYMMPDMGVTVTVYNGLVDAVHGLVRGGMHIHDAIAKVLADYNGQGLKINEEAFRVKVGEGATGAAGQKIPYETTKAKPDVVPSIPSGERLSAAIRFPNGEIQSAKAGERIHAQIYQRLWDENHPNLVSVKDPDVESGWSDSKGNFWTNDDVQKAVGYKPDTFKSGGITTPNAPPAESGATADYRMRHRPNSEGPQAHDLLSTDLAPRDIYDRPDFYTGEPGSVAYKESVAALSKIRGKPDAEITVYRASPQNTLNEGDWISFSKAYSKQHGMADNPSADVPVHAFKVKARDVRWAGDTLEEFGYYPEKTTKPIPGATGEKGEDSYVYHGTHEGAARNIQRRGLEPAAVAKDKPNRVVFSNTEQYAKSYADRKGGTRGTILRVLKSEAAETDPSYNSGKYREHYSESIITPERVEIKTPQGWVKLSEWNFDEKQKQPTPAPKPAPTLESATAALQTARQRLEAERATGTPESKQAAARAYQQAQNEVKALTPKEAKVEAPLDNTELDAIEAAMEVKVSNPGEREDSGMLSTAAELIKGAGDSKTVGNGFLKANRNGVYNGTHVLNALKNSLTPDEFYNLEARGLVKKFHNRLVHKDELASWIEEHGEVVNTATYGMEGKVSEAKREYDRMTHEWYETLGSKRRDEYGDYALLQQGDDQAIAHWSDADKAKAKRYNELNMTVPNEPRDTSPSATSHYESISAYLAKAAKHVKNAYTHLADTFRANPRMMEIPLENEYLGRKPEDYVIQQPNGKYMVNPNPHVGLMDSIHPGKLYATREEALQAAKNLHTNLQIVDKLEEYGIRPKWAKSTQEALKNGTELPSNVQRVDVVIPHKEGKIVGRNSQGQVMREDPMWTPDGLHENLPNTLGWAMIQYKTGPKGERIGIVVEQQDYHIRKNHKDGTYSLRDEGYSKKYNSWNEANNVLVKKYPILKDRQRLVMKAVVEQLRKENATHMHVIDAEGAMMVERHDTIHRPKVGSYQVYNNEGISQGEYKYESEARQWVADRPNWTYKKVTQEMADAVRPKQEPGMRLNYDTILPKIMEELSGVKGERVELGEHKNAFEKAAQPNQSWATKEGAIKWIKEEGETGSYEPEFIDGSWFVKRLKETQSRSNLIFRNADGTPKTDVSGMMFDIRNVPERKPRLMGSHYAPEATTHVVITDEQANAAAHTQRGIPEDTMLSVVHNIQASGNSGYLTHQLEHTGDLAHRAQERGGIGMSGLAEKLRSLTHILWPEKGNMTLEQEIESQRDSNAIYRVVKNHKELLALKKKEGAYTAWEAAKKKYPAEIEQTKAEMLSVEAKELERYVKAHKEENKPLTELGRLGKQAAISLGKKDYDGLKLFVHQMNTIVAQYKKATNEKAKETIRLEPVRVSEAKVSANTPDSIPDSHTPLPTGLSEHIASNSATAESVLRTLASDNGNPYQDFARELLARGDADGLKVRVLRKPGARSQYGSGKGEISLGDRGLSSEVVLEEIVHGLTTEKLPSELIDHTVTGQVLKQRMLEYLANPNSDARVKELVNVYLHAARKLKLETLLFGNEKGNSGYAGRPDSTQKAIRDNYYGTLNADHTETTGYRMSNLPEFIAGVLTDPEFRAILNKHDDTRVREQGAVRRVINAVVKFLGLEARQGSVLESAMKASEKLLSMKRRAEYTTDKDLDAFYAPQRDITGKLIKPTEDLNPGLLQKLGLVFTSANDKVRTISPERATALDRTWKRGENFNAIGQTLASDLKKFDSTMVDRIYATHREAFRSGIIPTFNSSAERAVSTLLKNYATTTGNLRLNSGMKINGRDPGVNKWYVPDMISTKVIETIMKNPASDTAEYYRQSWADYVMTQNPKLNRDDVVQNITNYISAMGGDRNNFRSTDFGAVRKAEGYGLPLEMRETKHGVLLDRYSRRFSKDLAKYIELESKPAVAKLFGLPDPNTGVHPTDNRIADSPEVKSAMQWVTGNFDNANHPALKAAVRTVSNAVLGAGTGIRDIAQIPLNSIPYMDRLSDFPAFARGVSNMFTHARAALEFGAVKPNIDRLRMGEAYGDGGTAVQKLDFAADWLRKLQGRELLENSSRMITFSVGKEMARDRIALAKSGDARAKKWFDRFGLLVDADITRLNGKELETALNKVAANFTDAVQGTYGPMGLPTWTQEGAIAPFASLQKFSIEKANTLYKDVWTPFRTGENRLPLLTYVFGAALTGTAIQQLNKILNNRKSQDPELDEALSTGNPRVIAEQMATLASLASFGGILGDAAKFGSDLQRGRTPRNPLSMPLATATSDLFTKLAQSAQAINAGENPIDVFTKATKDYITSHVQSLRMVSNRIDSDTLETKDKFRDLRVYNELYEDKRSQPGTSNPYTDLKQREFKRETDPAKAIAMLPELIKEAIAEANGDPFKLRDAFRRLKSNNYQTMPGLETAPLSFMRYLNYLKQTQGEEAAQERMIDYLKQNQVNKLKSAFVPSLN